MANTDTFVVALHEVQVCKSSRSTQYLLVQDKKFPPFPPCSLIGNISVGWRASDVRQWIESRPTADAFVAISKEAQP
jgi:predicted DNA-binding transcriptional regulator AlpA